MTQFGYFDSSFHSTSLKSATSSLLQPPPDANVDVWSVGVGTYLLLSFLADDFDHPKSSSHISDMMKLLKMQRITRARDLHCFMMIYDGLYLYHYCIIIIIIIVIYDNIVTYYDYALHRLLRFGDTCQPEESLVLLCTRGAGAALCTIRWHFAVSWRQR